MPGTEIWTKTHCSGGSSSGVSLLSFSLLNAHSVKLLSQFVSLFIPFSSPLRHHQRNFFVQWTVVNAEIITGQNSETIPQMGHLHHTLSPRLRKQCRRRCGKSVRARSQEEQSANVFWTGEELLTREFTAAVIGCRRPADGQPSQNSSMHWKGIYESSSLSGY